MNYLILFILIICAIFCIIMKIYLLHCRIKLNKKKKFLQNHYKNLYERTKRDKPVIDFLRKKENWFKDFDEVAKELNISEEEVCRISWDYRDALENDAFYNLDVVLFMKDYEGGKYD